MRRQTALFLISAILMGAHTAHSQSPCPTITVYSIAPDPFSHPKFKATVSGGAPPAQFTFNWSISTGEIISGQGTDLITVDLKRASGQTLTATVKVNGMLAGCPDEESESVLLFDGPVAILKESYGRINFRDEKKRLIRFAKELLRYQRATAYVTYYTDRSAGAGYARRRARRARRYLIKSGLRPSRITLVDGGSREVQTIELYVVTRSSRPPRP